MVGTVKVLHIGNPANVAAQLREGLRSSGVAESLVLETHNNRLNFAEDARFTWDWVSTWSQRIERRLSYALLLKSLISQSDILHIHASGEVAIAVARWARAFGKPVVRHFHGDELRSGDVSAEFSNANAVIVSTPDLLRHVPRKWKGKAMWIPNPFRFPDRPPEPDSAFPVRIVHSWLKDAQYMRLYGTELIREAVIKLSAKGLSVVLDEVTGVSHQEALARYRKAHIAVDKLHMGWYSMFSIECMAMAIPTLAGIAPDLRSFEPPVVPISASTLGTTLEPLIIDEQTRRARGVQQFHKAREIHSPGRVAHRIASIYNRLLA